MFGIIYSLFSALGAGVSRVGNGILAEKNRQTAARENRLTYLDSCNKDRLVSNGHRATYTVIRNERVLKDLQTGKIVHNFTKEKEKEMIEKAKQRDETVVHIGRQQMEKIMYADILNPVLHERRKKAFEWVHHVSSIYKDIETNKYYTDVYVNKVTFYMDVLNGHLVRLADGEDGKNKKGVWSIEEIMNIFNERQDNIKEIVKNNIYEMEKKYYLRYNYDCFIDENKRVLYDGRNE